MLEELDGKTLKWTIVERQTAEEIQNAPFLGERERS